MDDPKKKVIVVDDEDGIRQLVKTFLVRYHFDVFEADSGQALYDVLEVISPDLIVLDLMLPDIHGIDICKEIRKTSNVPIIMLTAAQGEMNTVLGFEAGADDYIEKPFSAHVLLSRIQAILRRYEQTVALTDHDLDQPEEKVKFKEAYFAQWVFILEDACLRHVNGKHLFLTKNGCLLLELCVLNHQSVLSRDQIAEALSIDVDDIESRAIDVQISRLRNKLKDKSQNNLIKSIRNKGYLLSVPVRIK